MSEVILTYHVFRKHGKSAVNRERVTKESDRFRIGIAQKALNLYLKNLWCLGEITTPPHCPLDRLIIDKLGLKWSERSQYDWTKIDDIEKYKELISRCDHKARERGCENIAEWELEVYKESNAAYTIPGVEVASN